MIYTIPQIKVTDEAIIEEQRTETSISQKTIITKEAFMEAYNKWISGDSAVKTAKIIENADGTATIEVPVTHTIRLKQ